METLKSLQPNSILQAVGTVSIDCALHSLLLQDHFDIVANSQAAILILSSTVSLHSTAFSVPLEVHIKVELESTSKDELPLRQASALTPTSSTIPSLPWSIF